MDINHYRYLQIFPGSKPQTVPDVTLGIEVTDAVFAGKCNLGNIDPQHGFAGARFPGKAAIDLSLTYPLPPKGTCLATIRPDLDALGAMAVLLIRANGGKVGPNLRSRIQRVSKMDRFDRGPWSGPRELPRCIDDVLASGWGEDLAVLAACAADAKTDLTARVRAIADWLLHGRLPERYRPQIRRNANTLLLSLSMGETRLYPALGGRVGVVVSPRPGALQLGYMLAPVVLACNPTTTFPGGAAGRKYTIARWQEGDADLEVVRQLLNRREPGWGGQAGIIGSPQDRPSILDEKTVLDLLRPGLPHSKEKEYCA